MKESEQGRVREARGPPGAGSGGAQVRPSPRVSSASGNLLRAHYFARVEGVAAASFILSSLPSGHRALLKVPSGLFVFCFGWDRPGRVVGRRQEDPRPGDWKGGVGRASKGESRKCERVLTRKVCQEKLEWH